MNRADQDRRARIAEYDRIRTHRWLSLIAVAVAGMSFITFVCVLSD